MAGDDPELPDRDLSPYPPAHAARVPSPANGKLSAVLVARPMGCLVVRVTFHKSPCVGLEVKFSKATDEGKAGEAVGDKTKTDARGVAGVEFMVPAGLYVCEIQGQQPTIVSTVPDPQKPHPVVTPIDRPYYDVDEAHEWHDEDHDEALPEADEPEEEAEG
jgi:hypothetical protein